LISSDFVEVEPLPCIIIMSTPTGTSTLDGKVPHCILSRNTLNDGRSNAHRRSL
jgi:hypothetical protein